MLNSRERQIVTGLADKAGLDPAVLMAVIEVESGGRVFARVGGRDEPLIRFEGHYFDRLCRSSVRAKARLAGLASPKAGAVRNPSGQAGRWALVERAARLDRPAALMACSWGVGQVMGAHWRRLGYRGVEVLVAEARAGLDGQVRLMLRFIDTGGLMPLMARRDWHGFARAYNGPAYRRHGYHTRLALAFDRYRRFDAETDDRSGDDGAPLRRGDRGAAVAHLQRLLVEDGAAIAVDGHFGRRTEAAVRAFQRRAGLIVDGIAGPRTMAALPKTDDKPTGVEHGAPSAKPSAKPLSVWMRLWRLIVNRLTAGR